MKLTLKAQNLPLIAIYVTFNIAIFLTLLNTGNIDPQSIQDYYEKLSLKDGVFLSVLILLYLVGWFQIKQKRELYFGGLPGCRAFSQYAKEDSRIDLKAKFGKIPTSPSEQNKHWYKIFKTLNDKSIDSTHKDSLLSVMTLEMFLLTIFLFYDAVMGFSYFVFLVLEYLMVRYCAKNSAERLVVNTLALASSKI